MQPSSDGTTLVPYTGADRDSLTINGQLLKLAWNVTTGDAGIHFRSSSFWSIILGNRLESVCCRTGARSYAEPSTRLLKRLRP